MPDRYALTGVGTCMEPIIPDGSCCVFDKRVAPKPGDIVGLFFTEEESRRRRLPGMIKRLVMGMPPAGFDGMIMVEQINLHRTYCIPRNDMLAVHKFLGIAESIDSQTAAFRLPVQEAA